MFQSKLTRSIFILMALVIILPLGYSYFSGGESIFPTPPPINNGNITDTSPTGISTVIAPIYTAQIRYTEVTYTDLIIPYLEITNIPIIRSTPFDLNRFQEVVFINHTDSPVRVIITSPDYLDKTIEDVVYLDLVYALHWIYIFVDGTVFVEQIINDQLYYINIFEDKLIIGLYKLHP